jgi:hypothetical protein
LPGQRNADAAKRSYSAAESLQGETLVFSIVAAEFLARRNERDGMRSVVVFCTDYKCGHNVRFEDTVADRMIPGRPTFNHTPLCKPGGVGHA